MALGRVVDWQRALVLGVALWCLGWMGAAWLFGQAWLALVGVLTVAVGYAAAIGLEILWLRRRHGEASPPPARRLLRAWAVEAALGPWTFAWEQPFRHRSVPDVPEPVRPAKARGVLLVHGYFCNRAVWNGWMRDLRRLGIPFVAIDLEPAFAPVGDYADAIGAAARRLAAATGGRPPVVVAHSMGGVAVRAWLQRLTGATEPPVHRVVTIGSPHHGTCVARFASTPNGRDLRIGSALLRALADGESLHLRRRFICFWSDCDNVVFPSASATLEGADNRRLEGWAHVHLLQHPAIRAAAIAAATDPDQMS